MALPYMKFYPKDWLGDTALQTCSLEARGLWIELLMHMHQSKKYGFLYQNDQPMTIKMIAKLIRIRAEKCHKLVQDLIRIGVISCTENGEYFSKKMVRDEERRSAQINNGKRGGNPYISSDINPRVNPTLNPEGYPYMEHQKPDPEASNINPGLGHDPGSRREKISSPPPPVYEVQGEQQRHQASIKQQSFVIKDLTGTYLEEWWIHDNLTAEMQSKNRSIMGCGSLGTLMALYQVHNAKIMDWFNFPIHIRMGIYCLIRNTKSGIQNEFTYALAVAKKHRHGQHTEELMRFIHQAKAWTEAQDYMMDFTDG